jgi:hypothetical protein
MAPTSATQHTAALLREAFGSRPFTGPDAQAAGISVDRLRQVLRWGLVTRVRRGWYVAPDAPTDLARGQATEIPATGRVVPTALVMAHELHERGAQPVIAGSLSAQWWGTDVPSGHGDGGLSRGTRRECGGGGYSRDVGSPALILVAPGSGIRRGLRHGILIREASIDERDIVRTDSGHAFTGITRTGIDCARGRDPACAFIIINSAIRRSLDPRPPTGTRHHPGSRRLTDLASDPANAQAAMAAFRATLDRCSGRGLASVRRVLDRVDPRLESALESLSWWRFGEHGLVTPIPQQWVRGASGRRYRVDFDFGTVVGEADGLGKYVEAGQLRAEKARQMDIELGGRPMVRWGWTDMWHHPESVIAALERAAA